MSKAAEYLLAALAIALIAFSSYSFSALSVKTELPMPKGTIKTIYSSNGEIVDCIDFYQQPAFDHPLLKDRKHEITPERPEFLKIMETESDHRSPNPSTFQVWRQSGECPNGTVPILRERGDIDEDAIRKMKRFSDNFNNSAMSNSNDSPVSKHEYAVVRSTRGRYYYGARAVMNIWKPFIDGIREFSLAQMWLAKGYGDGLETIEAGWHIYPSLYGDDPDRDQPTLFVYWTTDNYVKTGCHNLRCPGFVQLSKNIIPGAAVLSHSQLGGTQTTIDVQIARDDKTGDWALKALDEIIGYWPASLLPKLRERADLIQWGGEIIDTQPETLHTATEMGSGHFPNEGPGKAAFFHTLQIRKEQQGFFVDAYDLTPFRTNANCYEITMNPYGKPFDKVNFFFGGPGFSDTCKQS